MAYIVNLGDFNIPNYDDVRGKFSDYSVIDVYDFIEQANGGDKRSQLKKDAFKSFNLNLSKGKNIFLINNNLSHEVSALTSAVCFRNNGNANNRKVIINFDKHKDYIYNRFSLNTPIQYSNWGKCIHCDNYKNFINHGTNYIYLSTDNGMSELEVLINDIQRNEINTDLYITVDTDVYKKSCTSYGDGNFEFDIILGYIKKLKYCTGPKINLCGADVTGCADTNSGYYLENGIRKEINKDSIKEINEANELILRLLDFLCKW